MLRELHISNLAVIADARIELARGLNCFTGATGAGKSLVIGAIELLLGMRSAAEMLRPGAEEGRVAGVFEIADKDMRRRIAEVADIPVDEAEELLITRRLHSSGRSSIAINGNPVTLAMLKQVAELLVDVHGQHDHQYLLRPANQIDVIDQYADLWSLRQRYHETYEKLQDAKRKLEELSSSRSLRQQQLELYRFQAQEIDAAQIDPGEYEELQARSSVLVNLEKLKKDASATHSALYDSEGSVLERLKMMTAVLSELSELDAGLKPIATSMRDATLNLEESAFDLSRYLDRLDLDPAELAEVADRLNVLNRVLNKYGDSPANAMEYRGQIEKQIKELESASEDLSSIEGEIKPLEALVQKFGSELSAKRQAAAKSLIPQIESALAELGMERAKFTISFSETEAGASGMNQVEFVAQTNPGQLPQPLRKIASGGELSRIMLALKGILAHGDRVSVLVFDEIDSNVGGRLGAIIGSKLRALAQHHQVLCITHLPQIACYAERHLTVRKQVINEKTQTSVRVMDGEERVAEIAEMIGGQKITDTTRKQAQELLEIASTEASPPKKKRKAS